MQVNDPSEEEKEAKHIDQNAISVSSYDLAFYFYFLCIYLIYMQISVCRN